MKTKEAISRVFKKIGVDDWHKYNNPNSINILHRFPYRENMKLNHGFWYLAQFLTSNLNILGSFDGKGGVIPVNYATLEILSGLGENSFKRLYERYINDGLIAEFYSAKAVYIMMNPMFVYAGDTFPLSILKLFNLDEDKPIGEPLFYDDNTIQEANRNDNEMFGHIRRNYYVRSISWERDGAPGLKAMKPMKRSGRK